MEYYALRMILSDLAKYSVTRSAVSATAELLVVTYMCVRENRETFNVKRLWDHTIK